MTGEEDALSKEPLCCDSPLRLRWGQACPEAEEWTAGVAGLQGARTQQGRGNGEMTSGTEVWQVLKVALSDRLRFLARTESGRARSGSRRNAVGGICLYNRLPHREWAHPGS